ncbi:hypothetical protein TWF132_000903 [Orbilia oligospora]|nr:hypothetical protein TWF132_000903 [Orbilia oligospora]
MMEFSDRLLPTVDMFQLIRRSRTPKIQKLSLMVDGRRGGKGWDYVTECIENAWYKESTQKHQQNSSNTAG